MSAITKVGVGRDWESGSEDSEGCEDATCGVRYFARIASTRSGAVLTNAFTFVACSGVSGSFA